MIERTGRHALLAAVLAGLIATATWSAAAAKRRPNILWIMADDHKRAALSAYGSKTMNTPNIDRLAKTGMRFEQMAVTSSLCGPSRAALLSGRYGHLNGFRKNGQRFNNEQLTFPKVLQRAGYQTAIIGKWHLTTKPTGFDYYNVMPYQGRYRNCPLKESGRPWKDGRKGGQVHKGYLTDVLTDESIKWLEERSADKPFMLLLHHKAPHGPHHPASRHERLFAEREIPEPPTLLDDYERRVPKAIADKIRSSRLLLCPYGQYRPVAARRGARELA